jgi:hypothetical protein
MNVKLVKTQFRNLYITIYKGQWGRYIIILGGMPSVCMHALNFLNFI